MVKRKKDAEALFRRCPSASLTGWREHVEAFGAEDVEAPRQSLKGLDAPRVRKTGRKRTLSVALPASIVENAQGGELKALLVGQVARALTIYGVDEAGRALFGAFKGL